MEFGYPSVVVHHRPNENDNNGNANLQLIHDCNALYDMLHFVLVFKQ